MVTGKSAMLHALKNVTSNALSSLFKYWHLNLFVPLIKKRDQGLDEKAVLLIDNAQTHLAQKILQHLVQFLPPNVTALLQLTDQGVRL